jgi:hypothetical protein
LVPAARSRTSLTLGKPGPRLAAQIELWRQQLRAGRRHDEIEADLEAARVRLNPLAALALTGDAAKGGEVLPKLNSWGHRYADTYRTLNKGAHVAYDGDLHLLTGDAGNLVAKIRATLS